MADSHTQSQQSNITQRILDNIQGFVVGRLQWFCVVLLTLAVFMCMLPFQFQVNFYGEIKLIKPLPQPLFQRNISLEHLHSDASESHTGPKRKGKSTSAALLALSRQEAGRPVIYSAIERTADPCITLGISAGIYPESTDAQRLISFFARWIGYFDQYDVSQCDVNAILVRIGKAARGYTDTPYLIVDPLETFDDSQIDAFCAVARDFEEVLKLVLISTSSSRERLLRNSEYYLSFESNYLGDISEGDASFYLQKQCDVDVYTSCVAYNIFGGALSALHSVCRKKSIWRLILRFSESAREVTTTEFESLAPKILRGISNMRVSEREFNASERAILEANSHLVFRYKDHFLITGQFEMHFINHRYGNKSFTDLYAEITKQCENATEDSLNSTVNGDEQKESPNKKDEL